MGDKVNIYMGYDPTMTNAINISLILEHGSSKCPLLEMNQINSTYNSINDVKPSMNIICGFMTPQLSGRVEDSYIDYLVTDFLQVILIWER